MLHELFITHCTNGTSIMNPFTSNQLFDNCPYTPSQSRRDRGGPHREHYNKILHSRIYNNGLR